MYINTYITLAHDASYVIQSIPFMLYLVNSSSPFLLIRVCLQLEAAPCTYVHTSALGNRHRVQLGKLPQDTFC